MHLGNAAIGPECIALTAGAAGAGLAVAAYSARTWEQPRSKAALAVALLALVFAAQAVNVPVWPGISGHLVGGVLLAWLIGPGLGALTMALILAIQAFWLGDGGIAALGANIVNMGLLPAGLVALYQHWQPRPATEAPAVTLSSLAAAGLLALVSVPLAALLIVGETALLRPAGELIGWNDFAVRMLVTHLWIGLGEGAATFALAAAFAWLGSTEKSPQWRPATIGLAAAALLGVCSATLSSELPDGYEAAAQEAGFDRVLD
jgi:cobalt/nickel transport system permease protein